MPLQTDLQSILLTGAKLMGKPSSVIIGDLVVDGFPGEATMNDTILGVSGQQINGTEKTLRFAAGDVPGLISGWKLTWDRQNWIVKHVQKQAQGAILRVFLVEDV